MAYYAYKHVRDLLPQHIIDAQGPDYEGDGNYDGDQWNAAADYIEELKAQQVQLLEALKQLVIATKHLNPCPGTLEMAEKAIKEAVGEV